MSERESPLRWGRVVLLAIVASVVFGAADLLFSWNPIAAAPYLVNRGSAVFRPAPAYLLGVVAEGINGWVAALAFVLVERALEGSVWKRGLLFGLMIWGFWVVSGTLTAAVWLAIPSTLALTNVIFGLPKALAIAWGIAWFWQRYPARTPSS